MCPQDCDAKMVHFLEVFGPALADVETHWQLWQDEYKQVRRVKRRERRL